MWDVWANLPESERPQSSRATITRPPRIGFGAGVVHCLVLALVLVGTSAGRFASTYFLAAPIVLLVVGFGLVGTRNLRRGG
jgi:hypothetical protein